ncbi:hypothetical protein FRP1_29260 (plasmid) [Pseudonocardia sp. EC080625-04]|nr:hypothetical protein FRP1_29260 [Pseudonocardia sp. EC080625-04]ALL85848.1 hypothetical protein AD017_32380 [Pseudonocardia sp. EC080619-01]
MTALERFGQPADVGLVYQLTGVDHCKSHFIICRSQMHVDSPSTDIVADRISDEVVHEQGQQFGITMDWCSDQCPVDRNRSHLRFRFGSIEAI